MKKSSLIVLMITTITLTACATRPAVNQVASIPPLVIPPRIHDFRAQDYYPLPAEPSPYPPKTSIVPPGSSLWLNPRLHSKTIASY